MDKSPEEPQEHGCPAEIRCNITGLEKEGGSGTNHSLVPTSTPAPATTTTITAGKKSGALTVLVAPLILICSVVAWIPSPKMSSKLQSFSVSPSNNSSSSKCDAVLSVKKNNALCKQLSVELGRASVVYREERIWVKVMDPFYLRDEEEIMIRINMSAGAALWKRVAADYAAEKSRNGTLELEFSVDAIGKDEDKTQKIAIEILCGDLKLGFRSDSGAAHLIDGSKKCKTEWWW